MPDLQIELGSDLAVNIEGLFTQMGTMQAEWQRTIGFGAEGDRLRENARLAYASYNGDAIADAESALRNYYIAKIMLIVTEATEAVEEIRNNHPFDETYYPTVGTVFDKEGTVVHKPEGVLSELADIVIRIWSLTGEAEIGDKLGRMIVEKLNYNATRAPKHGGKAI